MMYVVVRTQIESAGGAFDDVTADNHLIAFTNKQKALKYLKESYEDELEEFLEYAEEGYSEYEYQENKAYYSEWSADGEGRCIRFELVELKEER